MSPTNPLLLLLLAAVVLAAGTAAAQDALNCTFRTPIAAAQVITIENNETSRIKVRTCDKDVCSSGTHKYVDCPAYTRSPKFTVRVDRDLHYIAFYNSDTQSTAECWPVYPGAFPPKIALPLGPHGCAGIGMSSRPAESEFSG